MYKQADTNPIGAVFQRKWKARDNKNKIWKSELQTKNIRWQIWVIYPNHLQMNCWIHTWFVVALLLGGANGIKPGYAATESIGCIHDELRNWLWQWTHGGSNPWDHLAADGFQRKERNWSRSSHHHISSCRTTLRAVLGSHEQGSPRTLQKRNIDWNEIQSAARGSECTAQNMGATCQAVTWRVAMKVQSTILCERWSTGARCGLRQSVCTCCPIEHGADAPHNGDKSWVMHSTSGFQECLCSVRSWQRYVCGNSLGFWACIGFDRNGTQT